MSRADDIVAALAPHVAKWRKFLADRTGVAVKAAREIRVPGDLIVQWDFDLPKGPKDEDPPAYFVRIAFDPDTGFYGLHAGLRNAKGKVTRETVLDDVFLNTLDDPGPVFSWVGKRTEEYTPGEMDAIFDELDEILGPPSGGAC